MNTLNEEQQERLQAIRKEAKQRHERRRKQAKRRGRDSFPHLPYECSWAFEQEFQRQEN